MPQGQRIAASLALDHRGPLAIGTHQCRESRTVERRRHRDDAQVGAERRLDVERERQPEIAVEAAFVNLVEQDRGDAGKLGIALDPRDEDPLGDHGHACLGRPLAVHPGRIAEGPPDRLPRGRGHAFGGGACGKAARRQQQDLARTPRLREQRGRDRGGLARPRRRDQHGGRTVAQGGEKRGQYGKDRKRRRSHRRLLPQIAAYATGFGIPRPGSRAPRRVPPNAAGKRRRTC